MKNKIFLALAISIVAFACTKKINDITYQGGKAPVLSSSITGTIPLAFVSGANEALRFNWTNPDYSFSTGISSQTVGYNLEFDTTGANFTSNKKTTKSFSGDLSAVFTQNEINDILLNSMTLAVAVPHNIDVRVVSRLSNTDGTVLYSNVLKFTVTPYAIPPKVTPPASNTLFITGAATQGGWMVGGDPSSVPAPQKFTKVDATHYVINSITLIGGQEYLLVPVAGDWGAKFGAVSATADFPEAGGDFKENGNNFKGPSAGGNYKIEVDFQRGKTIVTKL